LDLKNFVSEALYQIIAGIKAAQERIKEFHSETEQKLSTPSIASQADLEHDSDLHDVQFEIALIVEEPSQSAARLSVMGLSMIGKGSFEHIGSFVSRVRFSVPVSYPYAAKHPYIPSNFKNWGLNSH
jgi:predicted ester cyclase